MDPESPSDAQQIVGRYAAVLEAHLMQRGTACADSSLPYPKATIRRSIRTAVTWLGDHDQLSGELKAFLEIAYTSLADYVDDDVARLLGEYREAANALAADGLRGHAQAGSEAWRRIQDAGPVVARIAQAIADEAERLRSEFRTW